MSSTPNKKKDILYLKRTPTVTYDYASGGPIPESIKKYYVQQQLPVRKQSLAANNSRSEHRKRYQQPSFIPSPMRHSSIPSAINTNVAIEIDSATPTSPQDHTIQRQSSSEVERLAIGDQIDEEDEDDEFNFHDRPPSSIICQPMDPEEDDDASGRDILMSDEGFTEIIESWDTPPNLARPKGSIAVGAISKGSQHQRTDSLPVEEEEIHLQESRLSIDTVFTDTSDLTITMAPTTTISSSMTESYSSIFLSKMQSKREEQQKSIDAYRSQHTAIYTALLSEVANEFHKRITLSTMTKDGIEYHDVFNGKEAVDRLMTVLRITDRLEALEVGSALRSQNFFHDVNYEPFLIDSINELYAFKDMMNPPKHDEETPEHFSRESNELLQISDLPNGIYTYLTDCYSPTCTNDNLCYSWSCLKKKSLKQSQSQPKEEDTRLWSQYVPENVLEATLPQERKRQECIYELIYTEQDFVRDLQYVHDFWVEPLLTEDIIDEDRRYQLVQEVFFNIAEIRHVNAELARALEMRQSEKYIVSSIGDVMLNHVRNFQTFVEYGAHQVIGKFTFELEKKRNPLFSRFVEETERKPESRRLELNGYLTKPTTRLGRYNLLLREILKKTPDNNPDKEIIPQIMNIITRYLEQVNVEAGKCENSFNLQQIGQRLEFKSSADYVDLKLEKSGRQLLMKDRMKRKGNSSSDASDLQVFLFDHYLVLAKIKYEDHLEKYKTYRRPIPLELLSINVASSNNRQKRASSILPYSRSSNLTGSNNNVTPKPSTSESLAAIKPTNLSITFTHHGRKGSPAITLFTSAASIQQIWIKKIMDQKALLAETRNVFTLYPLIRNHFSVHNRINNTATINNTIEDIRLLIGTDQGVYLSSRDTATKNTTVQRIINVEKVTQVELMPESQLLVLADKTLWTFPLEIMAPDVSAQAKRGRSVSQNTAFFHVGECLSKTLVCVVKTNTLSATTIRVMEPVITDENKKAKSMFLLKRLVRSGPVALKAYKDLYLPSEASSINLLKSKMCISSPKEIGVVDMKTFGVQALLDPEDEELGFVFNRPDVRPVAIYRIQFAEYLVCYNEFAFLVDQRGRLIRSSVRIVWEGAPDSFALSYPHVLAFEPDFIEVRNVHTGELEQIIRGKNIRCTSTNTHNTALQGALDDPENEGYQLVFQLEKAIKKDLSS